MGSMKINFAEVEGGFETLLEGVYPVVIEKIEVRESKSSDHNYLNWELKVTDDDHENARLWMITSLSPKALFRLKDVFEALDVLEDELDLEWDEDVEITPTAGPMLLEPDVIGMACQAIVKNEMYDGKERNRVDDLVASDDAPSQKAAKSRRAERSGGAAKTATKSGGTRRKALR